MSVDDRLRAGLELNAGVVVPAGEARLAAVRARHRRRMASLTMAGVSAAAAVAVLAFSVIGGDVDRAGPPEPVPPAVSPTDVTTTEEGQIPDSTWRKVVTTVQALDAGVSRGRIRDDIGSDGRLPLELRLAGDTFTQSGDYGGSVWEIGDSGTIAYDERGRLVVTSAQCAPCPALTVTWRTAGRRLEVTRVVPSDGPMARVVWLGTWRRTD